MSLSDYYVLLVVGIVVSLLVEELSGVSTGGLIVPAVVASHLEELDILLYLFLISFITYLIVDKVLTKYMILYGKRKFTFFILVAILLKLIFDQLYPLLPFAVVTFRGLEIIAPALLASAYAKQGVKFTLPTAILAGLIVYFSMALVHYF